MSIVTIIHLSKYFLFYDQISELIGIDRFSDLFRSYCSLFDQASPRSLIVTTIKDYKLHSRYDTPSNKHNLTKKNRYNYKGHFSTKD